MLPLVHNTIVRNRSNTIPSNTNRSTGTTTTVTSDANSTNNQYGVQSSRDSSDCKKLKGKVCITTNTLKPFKRSSTWAIFTSKSSRSASTNSLNSSVVDETIAAVLRSQSRSQFLSELDLNQSESGAFDFNGSSLCTKTSSTTSTSNSDENAPLDLVHNSYGSDLNIHSNSHSSNELNRQSTSDLNNQSNCDLNQSAPSYPPPKYTPNRRPLLLRSQSAPHHTGDLLSNASILANIQEAVDTTVPFGVAQTLTVVQEDEELEMASRRNSYLNHRFNCRLAHEKEIIHIPGFNTKEELYERISNAFKITIDQILYCTLNSLNIDHLFDRHINFNDIIYVHLRGQAKEIEIEKTDALLGLTICDNSNGLCLIKKIKEGSVIDKIKFINVGDIIERINNINLIGSRHIDVANMLKAIPVGELFVIRLIESIRDTDASSHSPLQLGKQLKNKIKKGYETLRIRSKNQDGPPIFEELEDTEDEVTKKINSIIEDFVGISDSELVQQIQEIGARCTCPEEFLNAINESDLKVFNFNHELIFDIWGCMRDNRRED